MSLADRIALEETERALTDLLGRVRSAIGAAPGLPSPSAPAPALIALDPGHGGSDPGAVVPGATEKELVVPYAMGLRRALMDAGYTVRLTRTGDDYVGLSDRARIANEAGALCLVSLHANAASAEARNGAWILYDDASKVEDGRALAECVFNAMSAVPGLVDGTPQLEVFPDGSPWVAGRQLTVLSKARMPAILVELGFMTNPEDLSLLQDPEAREAVVRAIASGIIEWHKRRV